jgi:phosphohistidine phosphatase SixA
MNRNQFIRGLTAGIVMPLVCQTYSQTVLASSPAKIAATVTSLKQGGYVIVFRHGATNRNQADTDPLDPSNVSKQRLLSEKGRKQAEQVGVSFKKLDIPIGKIYTSKFNRAIETGKLIGNRASTIDSIDLTEGGLVVTPIENERRAQMLRSMAATAPDRGTNTLIITHKPNITDAFGKDWFEVKEGEASIFKPDVQGKSIPIDRLQATDWIALAGTV